MRSLDYCICIVLYLCIYIALLAVHNQKRFRCKRPREKRAGYTWLWMAYPSRITVQHHKGYLLPITSFHPQHWNRLTVLSNDPALSTKQINQQLAKLDLVSLLHEFPTFVFCTSVKDLGIILDQELTFTEHISLLMCFCFYQLRQLRVVSRPLSSSSTATLVHAFILNQLDY